MTVVVDDRFVEEEILAKRRAMGADHHDEVWDGVYWMSPNPNTEHQEVITWLAWYLMNAIAVPGLGRVFGGLNITDQEEDWTRNYRIPDIAVFLQGNKAQDRGTHWLGGPDFAVEVMSPSDRAREKFDFYAKVGVRELLLVERDPWSIELWRLDGDHLGEVGSSTVDQPSILQSEVLPVRFRLVPGENRPRIEVSRNDGSQPWLI